MITDFDIHIAARTVYMEARGEGHDGMAAVAWVIRNRVRRTELVPAAVCLWPAQFSCWHGGDANWLHGISVRDDDPVMAQAYAITRGVFADSLYGDITNGATHYLTREIVQLGPPSWYDVDRVTLILGQHIFLRLPNVVGEQHGQKTLVASETGKGIHA